MKQFMKRHGPILVVMLLAVTVLLFSLLHENNVAHLGQMFLKLRPGWLFLLLASITVVWMLEGLNLWLFAHHLQPDLTYSKSLISGITGIFYSSITPFGSGGAPMQIYMFSRMGLSPGKSGAVISAKTIVYQCVALVLALLLLLTSLSFFMQHLSHLMFLAFCGLGANVAFIAVVLLVSVDSKIITRPLKAICSGLGKLHLLHHPEKTVAAINGQLRTFSRGFHTIGHSPSLYLRACLICTAQILLSNLDTYFVYRAFGLRGQSPWLLLGTRIFFTMIVAFVPLPGNSGGMEASFSAFCHFFFGYLTTPAMLIWRLLTYYGSTLVSGLIVLFCSHRYGSITLRQVRKQMKEQPDSAADPADSSTIGPS